MDKYTEIKMLAEDIQIQELTPFYIVNNKNIERSDTSKYETESFAGGRFQGVLQGISDDIF